MRRVARNGDERRERADTMPKLPTAALAHRSALAAGATHRTVGVQCVRVDMGRKEAAPGAGTGKGVKTATLLHATRRGHATRRLALQKARWEESCSFGSVPFRAEGD